MSSLWTKEEHSSYWQNLKCYFGGSCPQKEEHPIWQYIHEHVDLNAGGPAVIITTLLVTLSLAGFYYRAKLTQFCKRREDRPDVRAAGDVNEETGEASNAQPSPYYTRAKSPMTMPPTSPDDGLVHTCCGFEQDQDCEGGNRSDEEN